MAKKNTPPKTPQEEENTAPLKPTLLEDFVPEISEGNRTIINRNNREVEISSTAAKILSQMGDSTIKFVK